jgi:hypothetical protein
MLKAVGFSARYARSAFPIESSIMREVISHFALHAAQSAMLD